MKKAGKGFTLVEVVVATLLSMLVFIGVMSVTTTAIRSHFQEIRNGENSTAEMYGIDQIKTLLQNTTHLEPHYPDLAGVAGGLYQEVRGCQDYSVAMANANMPAGTPGVVDGVGGNRSWYDLCWRPPSGACPGASCKYAALYLHSGTGSCPAGGWPAITCGISGGTNINPVAMNFYPLGYHTGNEPIFIRQGWGGVSIQFQVGIATANASGAGIASDYSQVSVAKYYQMTTGTAIQESYNAPLCSGLPCD